MSSRGRCRSQSLVILDKCGQLGFYSPVVALHHAVGLWMYGSRPGLIDTEYSAYLLEHRQFKILALVRVQLTRDTKQTKELGHKDIRDSVTAS